MKPLKKRTCIKCCVKKKETEYTLMNTGRLNPKCNECRNVGRQPLIKRNKTDNLIIKNTVNSYELVSTQRQLAFKVLEKAKQREQFLFNKGMKYKKTGIRAYVLTN